MKWSFQRLLSSPTSACQFVNPTFLTIFVLHLSVVLEKRFYLFLSSSIFGPYREIDAQEYVGEVKEKEKAKKQYEKAVSSGRTAGLVK